jgi:filamentous hemagglutinin family protein
MGRRSRQHRQLFLATLTAVGLLPAWPGVTAFGGAVATDGTVGPARTLAGPTFAVTADLGRQVGPNLFHSFGKLDLAAGEAAVFSGPASVTRVFARVTGGSPSSIDGTLRCTIPAADFYLMNPAGVVFGPNAALDVKGSFAVTTADHLRLADGGRVDARNPAASVLTSAPPAAFGFLGPAAGGGGGGVTVDRGKLAVGDGRGLAIVGGAVTLAGASLVAQAGRIDLLASAAPGEWAVDATAVAGSPAGAAAPAIGTFAGPLGRLEVTNAVVSADGPQGGRVVVRAQDVMFDRSALSAATGGGFPGGTAAGFGVDVGVRGDATIVGGSTVSTGTAGAAAGGAISLDVAGRLTVLGGSVVRSDTAGAGAAGPVRVSAGAVVLQGEGAPQDPVSLAAATPEGFRNAGLTARSLPKATGPGGDISVTADRVDVLGGAKISANTFGAGAGGAIAVSAADVVLDSAGANDRSETTGIFSGVKRPARDVAPTGRGGNVTVTAQRVEVLHGAQIDASTEAVGDAGNVTLTADRLHMDGTGTPFVTGIDTGAPVESALGPPGVGGNVGVARILVSGDVDISNGAVVNASTFGPGAGGKIDIKAGRVLLDGGGQALFTGLLTLSVGAAGGLGGNIVIATGTLRVTNGALVTASTLSGSPGGTVTVAAGRVELDRGGANFNAAFRPFIARIFTLPESVVEPVALSFGLDLPRLSAAVDQAGEIGSQTFTAAPAGTVSLQVSGPLRVSNLARVSAVSTSGGPAGDVTIDAGTVRVRRGGQIAVSAFVAGGDASPTGVGGNVAVTGRQGISVRGGQITAASSGVGGNVALSSTNSIFLDRSDVTAQSGTFVGLQITSPLLVLNRSSVNALGGAAATPLLASLNVDALITAESEILTSIETTTFTGLATLPAPAFSRTGELLPVCGQRIGGPASSFFVAGAGGAVPEPDGGLSESVFDPSSWLLPRHLPFSPATVPAGPAGR